MRRRRRSLSDRLDVQWCWKPIIILKCKVEKLKYSQWKLLIGIWMFQKWTPKSNQISNVLFTAGPKARTLLFFVVKVSQVGSIFGRFKYNKHSSWMFLPFSITNLLCTRSQALCSENWIYLVHLEYWIHWYKSGVIEIRDKRNKLLVYCHQYIFGGKYDLI